MTGKGNKAREKFVAVFIKGNNWRLINRCISSGNMGWITLSHHVKQGNSLFSNQRLAMSLAWQLRSFIQWNLQSNTLINFLIPFIQLLRTELIQRRDKKEWEAHSLQIYPREISVYFEPQQLSAYVKEILLISSTLELLWNKNDWWNIFHSLRYPSIFTQPLFKKRCSINHQLI